MTTLGDQTLRNYVLSATTALHLLTGRSLTIYDPKTLHQVKPAFHPFLKEQLRQRAAWSKPQEKKEPYTLLMLQIFAAYLLSSTDPVLACMGALAAAFDWARLGIFTGSRLAEYGQGRLAKGTRFNVVPLTVDAGDWAGTPLAFIRADFVFYDTHMRTILHAQIFHYHAQQRVAWVYIRFRSDKSKNNFTIRKFQWATLPLLDPVDIAINIFHWADHLGVPSSEPIGVFYGPGRPLPFYPLRDYHMTKMLRLACTLAYPDPNHYLRRRIHRLAAHSNRITAAVCLRLGGADIDEIAFRLRWNPASVPTYLRECWQGIGDILVKTLQGIYKTSN